MVGGVRVAFATWGGVASKGVVGCVLVYGRRKPEVAESIGDKRDMNKVAAKGVGVEGDDTAIGTEDDDGQ